MGRGSRSDYEAVIRWLANSVRQLTKEVQEMKEKKEKVSFEFNADVDEFVPRFAPGCWGNEYVENIAEVPKIGTHEDETILSYSDGDGYGFDEIPPFPSLFGESSEAGEVLRQPDGEALDCPISQEDFDDIMKDAIELVGRDTAEARRRFKALLERLGMDSLDGVDSSSSSYS